MGLVVGAFPLDSGATRGGYGASGQLTRLLKHVVRKFNLKLQGFKRVLKLTGVEID